MMKTEGKIVISLIEDKNSKTIRELSKAIKADYRITHTAARKLIIKGIIKPRNAGKSILCELNNTYYGIEILNAENQRKEELLKNKNLNQLCKEIMARMKTSFFTLLIFGSYAKKTQTRNSDIDLMIITNEKNTEEEINSTLALIPLKTHCLTFTEEEFARMKNSAKPNVIHEAIKNNVIMYGTENYYRMKNAQ